MKDDLRATALMFVIVIICSVVGWLLRPIDAAGEHATFKNSHQYKEGMEQQAAILRVNIVEVEELLKTANDKQAVGLNSQLRILKTKLKAIEE